MTFPYKLGAKAPKLVYGVKDLVHYATSVVPTAPSAVDPPPAIGTTTWGMALNNVYGCCTISGAYHSLMAWNAEVKVSTALPTMPGLKTTYFAMTGGQDTGLVEADVVHTWYTKGLFWDNQLAGYVPVDPKHLDRIHQAIAFYGCCYVGVALPQSAQTQFANGQPWTVVPSSPIAGGHCIIFVGYDEYALYAVTWGRLIEVTYPWWLKYGTESWCLLPQEFIKAGRGPTLTLPTLQADLSQVST